MGTGRAVDRASEARRETMTRRRRARMTTVSRRRARDGAFRLQKSFCVRQMGGTLNSASTDELAGALKGTTRDEG